MDPGWVGSGIGLGVDPGWVGSGIKLGVDHGLGVV